MVMGTNRMKSLISKNRVEWFAECIGWVLALMYCYWLIDPRLTAHSLGLPFQTTGRFFRDTVCEPGGAITYLSAYLIQFLDYRVVGALIIVGLVGLVRIFFGVIILRMRCSIPVWFAHIPGILMLISLLHYQYPWLDFALAVIFVLGFCVLYQLLPLKRGWQRFIIFALLAVPFYHLLAGAFMLAAVLIALWEMFDRKEWIIAIVMLNAAFCLPKIASEYLYVIHLNDAYFFLTPWKNRALNAVISADSMKMVALAQLLYISFPAILLFGLTLRWFDPGQQATAGEIKSVCPTWKMTVWRIISGFKHPVPLLAAALLTFLGNYDGNTKKLIQIDYAAQRQEWQTVLALGKQISRAEPDTISDINRALCHSQTLLDTLFEYPQRSGWPLWLTFHDKMNPRKCVKASDLLLELGQVNRAERMAVESLELNGYQAGPLKNLFWVNILKGEPTIAQHFLLMLEKVPNHGDWAKQHLAMLSKESGIASNGKIQSIKDFMILEDYVGEYPAEDVLKQLLRRSRRNRMAFDYLITHYLLNLETEKILENWNRFSENGYREIPRHVQEAVILYQKVKGNETLPQIKFLNPSVQDRFNRFNQIFGNYRNNLSTAQAALESEYGDTYWFYFLFQRSGKFKLTP